MRGELAKQALNGYHFERVNVIRPRMTFMKYVRNVFLLLLAILFIIVSLPAALTIIGLIVAAPGVLFALLLYQVGMNKIADVECPNCYVVQEFTMGDSVVNVKCAACKIPLILSDITKEVPKKDRPLKISI